ncbi:HNH endonuclease [Amycolatopsis sp. NPDC003865]
MARTCLACGADIAHKRSNAVYCNRTCKMAGWHTLNRGTPEGRAREKTRNTGRYRREGDHRRSRARAYYQDNRELRIQYAREWRKENPHRRRDQADRRAHLMLTNPGFVPFGEAEWQKLQRQYGYRCAYCSVRPGKLEKDHVVPLARGGRHAIANILPACKTCNISKYDSLLVEWRLRR